MNTPPDVDPTEGSPDPLARLRAVVGHAAHLLPAQGPITVFIHHNTLHAFEDLPFDEAVRRGAAAFGCQPYLSESKFRDALGRGRIRFPDLRAVLDDDLGERANDVVPPRNSRVGLRLAMLQHPLPTGSADELRWYLEETNALRTVRPGTSAAERAHLIAETRRWVMRDLRAWDGAAWAVPGWVPALFARFRDAGIETWDPATWEAFSLEALWGVCLDGVAKVPARSPDPDRLVRHRDLLLRVAGVDTDQWVNAVMIRFCAAYLDQGVSHWLLPDRERGFLPAFCSVYRGAAGPPDRWFAGVRAELARLADAGTGPLDSLAASLAALGVGEDEWGEYLSATLLALRGWCGMIHEAEERPDRFAFPAAADSLIGFLAVRLLLDRFAAAHAAREELGYTGPLSGLRDDLRARLAPPTPPTAEARALPVFLLAQTLGWTPDELHHLTPADWAALVGEIEAFDSVERRRVFHLAYERRFREQTLDALCLKDEGGRMKDEEKSGADPDSSFILPPSSVRPRFQVITCIDEREESFRRHLEEVAPDCETIGTAGFFAVVMYYRGVAEAHYAPLCPVVVHPKHWVEERPFEAGEQGDRRTRRVRRALGRTSHQLHLGTRGVALGAVITTFLGVLATFPLVARVLFPRLTARLRRRAGWLVRAPKKTRLRLERTDPQPGPEGGGVGFSVEEMTGIAERVLRDVGLTRNFARLVFTLGHGSHSMNNPHESAHDCGACGGAVGGPNGRAVAQILNDPRVRTALAARGLPIPADTVFVGGLHNTCNEYVKFVDTDLVPATHQDEFRAAQASVEEAVGRNAHERARRFESAPLAITPAAARQHMDDRAEDLAQVRPEWGHATNAVCIVGRRARTRGLFLDRRPFL
ncbi:MAG TPA: putative inorganic carbon transporter subunit DabA, partial [Urbifossiella sp.]|nr:putative inorganic carbon transporter subunit DabA [Urbifossiella sp.]